MWITFVANRLSPTKTRLSPTKTRLSPTKTRLSPTGTSANALLPHQKNAIFWLKLVKTIKTTKTSATDFQSDLETKSALG
jgi:hypothetical protein